MTLEGHCNKTSPDYLLLTNYLFKKGLNYTVLNDNTRKGSSTFITVTSDSAEKLQDLKEQFPNVFA